MFDVAVSADGGAVYSPVQDCIGLAGNVRSCLWTTPKPLTANARIRVTAHNAGGSVADASNAAFRIVDGAASIVVSFPNTAVNVGIGSTHVIKWNHNLGVESFVKVELSRDGGVTFPETLAAMHKNAKATTGSFDWRVTGPAMAAAQARIRVSWINGPVSDVSNTKSRHCAGVHQHRATKCHEPMGLRYDEDADVDDEFLGARDRANVQLRNRRHQRHVHYYGGRCERGCQSEKGERRGPGHADLEWQGESDVGQSARRVWRCRDQSGQFHDRTAPVGTARSPSRPSAPRRWQSSDTLLQLPLTASSVAPQPTTTACPEPSVMGLPLDGRRRSGPHVNGQTYDHCQTEC